MSNYFQSAFDEGRNLTEESTDFPATLFRDEQVFKIIQLIARGRSVLLVGENGIGKTRVVHELVSQMRRSGRAKVFEFSVSQLLSGTKFLGEWESKVTQILKGAEQRKCIIYFSDIWNLPTAAKSSNRDSNAWDVIRPYVEQNRVQLIGELTPSQLTGLSQVKGFSTLFESIEIPPLSPEQVFSIVKNEAARGKLVFDDATLTRVMGLCQQFLAAAEGPGPALELIEQVRDYQSQKRDNDEPENLSPKFVEKVFSIYSGLPLIVVSPSVTKPVTEVKAWFEDCIIGQKAAIDAVVETIALYKAGLHDPDKPIGSFLFVGPTGVGKTEMARALARFLFGTENRLLRFDLSEYKDYHSFQLLIGDPARPSQEARLVDPVKAKPFQVILLDEIEKAHANVWDLLLQLLDEGRLTTASGKPVNFRNTIIIATSNVGAMERAKSAPGFVSEDPNVADERMLKALETAFRPEFLNRFQHVVPFHALSRDDVRQIARMELNRILGRQGIASRQISVDVTTPVLDLIVAAGYDESYGARVLRRMVQRFVSMPIATLFLEKPVEDGSILRLVAQDGRVKVEVIETPEIREKKAEARPIKSRLGSVSTPADVGAMLAQLEQDLNHLVHKVNDLEKEKGGDDREPEVSSVYKWSSSEDLARYYRKREKTRSQKRRLDALHQKYAELEDWQGRAVSREEREQLVGSMCSFQNKLESARREMVLMPEGSFADALVVLSSLGPGTTEVAALFEIYSRWAKARGYSLSMVCEPMSETEPAIFALSGNYVYGYLHLETGHHRFRNQQGRNVVNVQVMPWIDRSEPCDFKTQRALKKNGLLGGRVRSRLQPRGNDLLIQNEKTLAENRLFAGSIVASWQAASGSTAGDELVRRYDSEPFLLKDYLTGINTGKADVILAQGFNELLCERLRVTYAPR